jgi:hypothetical protein
VTARSDHRVEKMVDSAPGTGRPVASARMRSKTPRQGSIVQTLCYVDPNGSMGSPPWTGTIALGGADPLAAAPPDLLPVMSHHRRPSDMAAS